MMLPPGFTFDTATASDNAAINLLDAWAFPTSLTPAQVDSLPSPRDPARTVLVRDHDRLLAMHSSYAFAQFQVPGATLAAAGLTWVGVHPAVRRRGILKAMMARHFADCQARGEAISVLTAAEFGIYGRFGYGVSSYDARVTIARGASLRAVPGSESLTVRIETRTRAAHETLINDLHRTAGQSVGATGLNRPGWATRETPQLQDMWHDEADPGQSREPERIIIVERDGTPVGYTTLRRSLQWEPTGPRGTVSSGEVVALDPAAAHRLWSTLLDLDLTSEVKPYMIPPDDPIFGLLEDTRAIAKTLVDNVWTRIINLPAALAGRQYSCAIDLVLDVTDPLIPANAGRWHLVAPAFGGPLRNEPGRVTRTDRAADITLDIRELGSIYLGGQGLAPLATAGQATGNSSAIAQATTAFGWPNAPVSSWEF